MNQVTHKLLSIIAVMVMLLTFTISATKAQDTASVRFAHVIPGLTAIDVYVNDSLSVERLDFGQGSTYLTVPSGTVNVKVTLAGLTTVLWQQNVDVASGDAATLIASSIANIQFDVFVDDLSELGLGNTRLTIINLINESPPVDIQVSGDQIETQTIAFGVEYQGVFGPTSQPPADTYLISIVPSDGSDALIQDASVSLNSLSSQIVVLYGTAVAPEALTLSAPTVGNSDSGFVRIAHGVADAPSVDVLIDGAKVAPSLSYGEATEHLAVPAGEHTVSLQVAGSGSDVLSETVIVEAGTASTIAALGTVDTLSVSAFSDDISATDARTALISVINTLADSDGVTVVLDGATVIADGLAAGSASETAVINPPVSGEVSVSVTGGAGDGQTASPTEVLYGGVYYNALVLNDSNGLRVAFFATNLTRSINSAPNSADVVVEAVEPTAVPTEEPAAQPTEVAEAQPTSTLAITQPIEDTGLPTARVLLDPGANLQLRLFPSSEAASIGLAPSGSILTVNGREGAPIDILTGEEIPVDDAGNLWVDPAEGLAAGTDLDAGATWLNVNFTTVDGGVIVAWANAQFLEVLDDEGELQRLAELPTVPGNQAGQGVNTMLPTVIPTQEVGPVTGTVLLDPGANLQLRQYPSSDSLTLGGMPSGSQVVVNGREGAPIDILTGEEIPVDDAGNLWVDPAEGLAAGTDLDAGATWLNVDYTTSDGGTIRAWVNAQYLAVRDGRGNPQRLADLPTVPGNDPGEGLNTAIATIAPTQEAGPVTATILLDPGVNLQLRQFPSSEALSLGGAPSGSIVIVNGREGAPIDLVTGEELPIDDAGNFWVDPAESLAADADLVAGETWLNIDYSTNDGGTISAWVNAQYVAVRDGQGNPQRLANLETIPGTVPGEATNTSVVAATPEQFSVKAVVYNLDANTNLNIRRLPSTEGEVLARVTVGTELDFLGEGQSGEWVLVGYTAPEGGSVTGWTSTQYVQYQYKGVNVTKEQITEAGLWLEADEETVIGEVSANVAPVVLPTIDPFTDAYVATILLDPDARLNLRRVPSTDGEVLANMPSGAQIIVQSRTEDAVWIEVIYDGTTGWTASQFVTITYNGESRDILEVPVNTTINQPEATATPDPASAG